MDASIETIKQVSNLIEVNRPLIIQKTEGAMLVLSAIKQVTTDEEDKKANDALVHCNAVLPEIDKLRKGYTSILDAWKKNEMEYEKSLKEEAAKVRAMRDEYLSKKAKAMKEAQDKIDAEKNYKLYEAEIKKEIKVSIELGVFEKLEQLEKSIASMFEKVTLQTVDELSKKLTFTPKLKDEYFISLFTVDYDSKRMTEEQFEDIKKRARNYFIYESINDTYVKNANDILEKWKATIPAKKKELEIIFQGGQEAERLKKEAAARQQKEREDREVAEAKEREKIQAVAEVEAQGESLAIEFQAQVQTQDIGELDNARKKRVYSLSPGTAIDFMLLSKVMGKIIINVLSEKKVSIHKLNSDKSIKTDEHGRPVFVDGVQWWLDKLADIPYPVKIEGLEMFDNLSTVARKK